MTIERLRSYFRGGLGPINKVVGFLLIFFFGVFRFGFYWSIWVYLLWLAERFMYVIVFFVFVIMC